MKEGRKAHKGVTVNLLLFQSQNSGHIGTVSYERSQGTPRGESATGRQTSRARAVQWKHRPNRQEYREDWLSWFIVRTHTHTHARTCETILSFAQSGGSSYLRITGHTRLQMFCRSLRIRPMYEEIASDA